MTRVPDIARARAFLTDIQRSRTNVDQIGRDISSGIKVRTPGDSTSSGAISQARETLSRVDDHMGRVSGARSVLTVQEDIMNQANEVIVRAKELASQAANETLGVEVRRQMAAEVFELRDQYVSLANTTFQGRYIYGGNDDDDPPFDATTYTNSNSTAGGQRYLFDNEAGSTTTRSIAVTDSLSVEVTSRGDLLFADGIEALERLGRALEGFATTPSSGTPDGGGDAYTFPDDFRTQTLAIQGALDTLERTRNQDIIPERTRVGARLVRLDTADSLLKSTKENVEEVLAKVQNTDIFTAASQLTQAQNALEASLTVSSRVLSQSILDFL